MKKMLTCPKCAGRKIWHVAQLHERTADGTFLPLSVAIAPARLDDPSLPARKRTSSKLGNGILPALVQGAFETFTCVKCGYAELYTHGLERLVEVPGHVTLIDNEPKATLR